MSAHGGVNTETAASEMQRQELELAQAIEREAARHESDSRAHKGRGIERIEQHAEWPLLSRLPMRINARIPLPRFQVKDLLALEVGQLLTSTWLSTDDVPLTIGAVQLSWSEFEVIEQRMSVRLTRLA
jgi:flagellar motor switch protein FliN/FliY